MKDYLLSDDEEEDNRYTFNKQNSSQNNLYFHTQPARDIQQSAQFNSDFIPMPEIHTYTVASQNNLISSQYLKEQSTQQENGDLLDTKNILSNRQSNNQQSTDPQSLSQFDFNTNSNSNNNNNINQISENQNTISIQLMNKSKEQGNLQVEKDNNSVKTSSSNKSKLIQQGQQTNVNTQNTQQLSNIKGKRESILLPSSQFEFQNNIKNGGISQHLLNNQNDNIVNYSYLSNCLKDEEILNQNGETITNNNGFFSRKVSDNLLDDLDQIDQSSKREQEDYNQEDMVGHTQEESKVSKEDSNLDSHKSSENSSQNIEDISKSLDYLSQIKITQIQESKQKKFSQDSQNNNIRSREFSFKYDLLEQKKDGAKTIKDIEDLLMKELGILSQQLGVLQNQQEGNQNEQDNQLPSRSSILSQIARRSKVRGSNIQSEYSGYEVQSSRVEENIDDSQQFTSEHLSSFYSDDNVKGENNTKKGIMEKYALNGNSGINDDIILDEGESEEQDLTNSFDNKYIYTRNRSNVYTENKILRSRNSHLDKVHKFQNQNAQTRKRSSQISQDIEGNQKKQNETSQSSCSAGCSESNIDEQDDQEDFNESQIKLTQEEKDQIREEVNQDLQRLKINLDNTFIGSGLGQNFKKYTFPLVFKNKDNNLKKRLQEKYKLIQNFQYLLNLDSNIFATDQHLYDQTSKFIYTNNLKFLKMMNKLPENNEEIIKKKKKSIEEIQSKYQQRKPSYLQQLEQLKKNNEKKENQNDSEINSYKNTFFPKKSLKPTGQSLKRNSQQPAFNNLRQRKSIEQIAYNSIEDEIEEDDRHQYDNKDYRGFSLQVYAINKHNYYVQFKEEATDSILQSMIQTMESFSQELKEEDQILNEDTQGNGNDINLVNQNSENENNNKNKNKKPLYSLLQDINQALNLKQNTPSPRKIEKISKLSQIFNL